jgi:hypothetical protein
MLENIYVRTAGTSQVKEWQQLRCELKKDHTRCKLIKIYDENDSIFAGEYQILSQTKVDDTNNIESNNEKNVISVSHLLKIPYSSSTTESSSEISNFTLLMRFSTEQIKDIWKDAIENSILTTEPGAYQPDLWPQVINPTIELDILYLTENQNHVSISISHGNRIAPSKLRNYPKISINSESPCEGEATTKSSIFTLIMFDIDRKYENTDNSYLSQSRKAFHGYLHWVVINIHANHCEKCSVVGEEVFLD